MASLISEYQYDIFISYRQNDNKRDKWVTQFVEALKDELDATLKNPVSIYFDENPHDGLLDTHDVDKSLKKKLKCLILIPIISQTYCDPNCFAWEHEFIAFRDLATTDEFGLTVSLASGNIASRILPIKIHELDIADIELYERETNGVMRAIEFTYKEPGVNRPLRPNEEHAEDNLHKIIYRNQINKVANGIKEVINGLKQSKTNLKKHDESEPLTRSNQNNVQLNEKLKSRNMIRVGLSYILSAFVFWKVSQIIISIGGLSMAAMKVVTLVLIILFPIAITFAWLYEIGPRGFVRSGSAAAQHNPFSTVQKKPLTSNAFLGAIAFTIIALFYFFPNKSDEVKIENYTNTQKSIAVLPFVNMSNDAEQEYFSDGISEELINALAKIPELKVSGRTSSFSFKGKNENMVEIGRQLGVNSILEGSVRKSGSTVRITAQLINVEDGFHLWTETFDRELKDIFAIQDEITIAIVDALKVHLVNEETLVKSQSVNIEAYSTYLKARQKLALRGLDNLLESRDLFYKVIESDSNYAPAYSGLGRVQSLIVNFSIGDLSFNNPFELARELANKALSIDKNSAEAYSVLGTVNSWYDWNWAEAEKNFLKSLELSPNDAEMYNFIGDYYAITYNKKLAIELELKALELDPLHAINHWDLGGVYAQFGKWEKSVTYYESALKLDGSFIILVNPLFIESYAKLGLLDRLDEKFRNLKNYGASESEVLNINTLMAFARNNENEALLNLNLLRELAEKGLYSSALMAEFYVKLKKYEDAAYWIERAYKDRDVYIVFQSQFTLPEHYPDNSALQAALDKPEWNALYEIKRKNQRITSSD